MEPADLLPRVADVVVLRVDLGLDGRRLPGAYVSPPPPVCRVLELGLQIADRHLRPRDRPLRLGQVLGDVDQLVTRAFDVIFAIEHFAIIETQRAQAIPARGQVVRVRGLELGPLPLQVPAQPVQLIQNILELVGGSIFRAQRVSRGGDRLVDRRGPGRDDVLGNVCGGFQRLGVDAEGGVDDGVDFEGQHSDGVVQRADVLRHEPQPVGPRCLLPRREGRHGVHGAQHAVDLAADLHPLPQPCFHPVAFDPEPLRELGIELFGEIVDLAQLEADPASLISTVLLYDVGDPDVLLQRVDRLLELLHVADRLDQLVQICYLRVELFGGLRRERRGAGQQHGRQHGESQGRPAAHHAASSGIRLSARSFNARISSAFIVEISPAVGTQFHSSGSSWISAESIRPK